MSKPAVCRHCGHASLTIDRFTSAGDLSCSRCGTVQEESHIVSEVQFGESSSGAAMVQGAMVGSDQVRATFAGGRQNAMESREQTEANGKKKIRRIAAALNIPEFISDSAGEWFKLALAQNFVQGRRSQNVLATCLYVACRKEKTHHMLIDFSSRLQIPVYSLGATFLKMVKALCISQLPLADPSLFIQHFAEKLDFGDQCTKVVKDAVKLAQRMSNDWIHEGRRPAGIAGACVLLAARMNNFRRTHAEIVAVAHVGPETLQRRLNEFKSTKSGELTVSSFRESEGTEAANPPSYNKNRKLEEKIRDKIDKRGQQIPQLFEEVELERQARESESNTETSAEPKLMVDEDSDEDDASKKLKESASRVESAFMSKEEEKKSLKLARANEEFMKQFMKTMMRESELSSKELEDAINRVMNRKKQNLSNSIYNAPGDMTDKNAWDANKPRNLVKNLPKTEDLLSKVSSSVEITSDDDDDVTLDCELTEEEIRLKTQIWTGLNHEFIVQQEKKRLKMEADVLAGNTSGQPRKKRQRTINTDIETMGMDEALSSIGESSALPLTAAEKTKKLLSKKSLSKKLNYGNIDNLFAA